MSQNALEESIQYISQVANDFLSLIPQSTRQATATFFSNALTNIKSHISQLESDFEKYKIDAEKKIKELENEIEKLSKKL